METFIKIRCDKCSSEQMVFERASTLVRCLTCRVRLTHSTGGKAKLINCTKIL